jgi:hypothetical protein
MTLEFMEHIRHAAARYAKLAKPRKKDTPETRVKKACVQYMKVMRIRSFPLTAGMGSYPGLPDRIVHYNGRVFYMEFKRPAGGRLSPHQKRFRLMCIEDGIPYVVIRGISDIERELGVPTLFNQQPKPTKGEKP